MPGRGFAPFGGPQFLSTQPGPAANFPPMRPYLVFVLPFLFLPVVSPAAPDPAAVARIDALVDAHLAKAKLKPNPPIDDATFLRRAWLSIGGRVPTFAEAESFQNSNAPDKRAKLIAELLASEAHVSHFYNYWADILRLQDDDAGGRNASVAYQLWVKRALRENRPYDRFVAELVSARGKFWENGAIGYYHRDRGMPLDNLSNTVRIFLGVRLECAQCHNHPFDKWTQMDFYKMAAFSHNMDAREIYGFQQNRLRAGEEFRNRLKEAYLKGAGRGDNFPMPSLERLEEHIERHSKSPNDPWIGTGKGKNIIGIEAFRESVKKGWAAAKEADELSRGAYWAGVDLYYPLLNLGVLEKTADLKLPHDYQYPDAKPGDVVAPGTMFGATADLKTGSSESPIEAYAKWMTSPENPTFTRVIANRLWKRAFGHGVIEPVDDFTELAQPVDAELMAALEEVMRKLKYDLRAFQEVIYNTRAWQRAADATELEPGEPFHFPGPALRRLSAEQIWDSVVALTIEDADQHRPLLRGQLAALERERLMWESLEGRSPEEYIALMEQLAPLINDRDREKTRVQDLMMAAQKKGDQAAVAKLKEEYRAIEEPLRKAKLEIGYVKLAGFDAGKMDLGNAMMTGGEMKPSTAAPIENAVKPELKLPAPPSALKGGALEAWRKEREAEMRAYWQMWPKMARASELESPAPRGHFLRDFGQSDREMIENAADNASVPQALNLLNGPLFDALTNPYTVFGAKVKAAAAPEEKARAIFQAMLTREPSAREVELVKAEVAQSGEAAYAGIVWALFNTQQFRFLQ